MDGPLPPRSLQADLDELADSVVETLIEAQQYGTCVIVTNAETGWIDLTARRFLPSLEREIRGIRQISARSLFEPLGVRTPFEWKERAFEMVIHQFYSNMPDNTVRHVISLGDSAHERDALLKVCGSYECAVKTRCKSLKFMERPDLEHLKKQHSLIRQCMAQIASHPEPLDLCIQTSPPSPK